MHTRPSSEHVCKYTKSPLTASKWLGSPPVEQEATGYLQPGHTSPHKFSGTSTHFSLPLERNCFLRHSVNLVEGVLRFTRNPGYSTPSQCQTMRPPGFCRCSSLSHGHVSNGGATVVCPVDPFDDVCARPDVQEVLRIVVHVPCGATVDDEVDQLSWVSAAEDFVPAEERATPAL